MGWRLSVVIVATQVVGDLANTFVGSVVRGGTGFAIASAVLIYLLSGKVRAAFLSGAEILK